jgi:two-component system sensor histidine kinase QseC
MTSIRTLLYRRLVPGLILVLIAGGLFLDRAISFHLRRQFDEALLAGARSFASMSEATPTNLEFEFQEAGASEPDLAIPGLVFQIWRPSGEVVLRSSRIGPRDLPRPRDIGAAPALYGGRMLDGRQERFVAWRFFPRPEEEDEVESAASKPIPEPLLLVLGGSRAALDSTLRTLRATVVVSVLALLGATLLLVRLGLDRGLAPLEELVQRLRGIDASRLDARADAELAPVELRPVVEQLNALLSRLSDSFERERAFSANLAHELRTPISELRVLSEVALQDPADTEVVRPLLEDARSTAVQMQRIVDDLLNLARLESPAAPAPLSPTSLAELVLVGWRPVHREAAGRGIVLSLSGMDELQVATDPSKLGLAIANLLANAVQHGVAGSPVSCRAETGAEGLELRIENRAQDLDSADLPHLFHRFWRKDPARSGGHNAGLGLALVAAVCAQLGLTCRATLEEGDLFRITLAGLRVAPATSSIE